MKLTTARISFQLNSDQILSKDSVGWPFPIHSTEVTRFLQQRPRLRKGYTVASFQNGNMLGHAELLTCDSLLALVVEQVRLKGEPYNAEFHAQLGETEAATHNRIHRSIRTNLTVVEHPFSDILELRYRGFVPNLSRRVLEAIRICYMQRAGRSRYSEPKLVSKSIFEQIAQWSAERAAL